MRDGYFNQSHCADPTAYFAMKNTEHKDSEHEEVTRLIRTLKKIIRENGFELENRIVLRHKESGKIYK